MGGASQNWTLSSHFFAFFYSLSVSTTLELALKSFLPHPFSVTSVFRIYFLLPLPMHISDFRPSSSHTKILAVARQALLDAVSFLMFTSSLSPHSKDLSTITISYLINLSYIFFSKLCLCSFAADPPGCACILSFQHDVSPFDLPIHIQSFLQVSHPLPESVPKGTLFSLNSPTTECFRTLYTE